MDRETGPEVLVIYGTPLLGQGIAAYLGQAGVHVRAVEVGDRSAVAAALDERPRVVVFQSTCGTSPESLARAVPEAMLVDVGHTLGTGPIPDECRLGLEDLLEAVRSASDPVAVHGLHRTA